MSAFPLPYVITVSDGVAIRTFHPPALGKHRPAIEAALAELIEAGNPGIKRPRDEQTRSDRVGGPATTDMMTQGEIARTQGFTGDCCTGCGGFSMRRNGTCLLCVECGATTGCS